MTERKTKLLKPEFSDSFAPKSTSLFLDRERDLRQKTCRQEKM